VPRVRGLALLILLPLLRPPPAGAAPPMRASGEIDVGGGYDDNMLLATAPDAPTSLNRLGGWFGQAAPALTLGLGGPGFRLEASYAGDYRYAHDVGQLYFQEGDVTASFPALGPVRLHLSLSGGYFDASLFPEDQFLFAGGEVGLRAALLDSLRVAGRYRAQWRQLGDATMSTDVLHAADARVLYLPSAGVEIGPRGALLIVQPTAADGLRFLRWRAGLDGGFDLGPLTTTAGVWLGALELGALYERHVGGTVEVRWPISRYLALFATADLAFPISAGASQDYARRMYAVGLTASLTVTRAAPGPPPEVDLRPRVEPGRVRLRLKAARGADVRVLGSWDDWQPPGKPLPPTAEGGVFEAWLELPAGSHRYHFVVDGQTRRPPDAPRYAPDGFGGEVGILDIDAPQKAVP
jgi:Glycogen recognition site of AMP-activated protein kinase